MKRMEISTPRLRLAAIAESSREELIRLLSDEEIGKTYMVPELKTEEQREAVFTRLRGLSEAEDRFVYGIYSGEKLIGMIHEVCVDGGEIELGYFIDPAEKNRGYASEALAAAMEELFAMGYQVVKAGAFEENPASMRVMTKCGMKATGETELIDYRGERHNCLYFASVRDERP